MTAPNTASLPPPPPPPPLACVFVVCFLLLLFCFNRTTYYKGEFSDCFGHSFNSVSEFAMKESNELKCVGTGHEWVAILKIERGVE